MGVEGLKQFLKTRAPQAPLPNFAEVHIEDIASRLFKHGNGNQGGLRKYLDQVVAPLRGISKNGTKLIIVAFDNPRFPTPTKQEEQAERAKAERARYPDHTVLDLERLALVCTDPDGHEQDIEDIQGHVLMSTKLAGGAHIAQAFIAYLQRMPPNEVDKWHPDTTLVVDFEPELFVWRPRNRVNPCGVNVDELKGEPLGEGEVKAIKWLYTLRNTCSATSYAVQTVDSDALALLVYHAWSWGDERKYFWFESAQDRWNINAIISYFKQPKFFGRAYAWLLWCTLLGTDHFRNRRDVLKGVSNDVIRDVVNVMTEVDEIDTPERFDAFLRFVYTRIADPRAKGPAKSWAKVRSMNSRAWTYPSSPGVQHKIYRELQRALHYWHHLSSVDLPSPQPPSVASPMAVDLEPLSLDEKKIDEDNEDPILKGDDGWNMTETTVKKMERGKEYKKPPPYASSSSRRGGGGRRPHQQNDIGDAL